MEELHAISTPDAKAEGFVSSRKVFRTRVESEVLIFLRAWDEIYDGTEYAVKCNPWVWVYDFELLKIGVINE